MKKLVWCLLIFLIVSTDNFYSQDEWASDEEALSLPQNWDDSAIDNYLKQISVKKRISVLPFEKNEELESKIHSNLSDIFTAELGKANIFELIERKALEKILEEQNFQMSGIINDETAIEAGNLLGAEYSIAGSVTSVSETKEDKFAYDLLKFEVGISIRVLDIKTGEMVLTEKAIGNSLAKIITTSSGETVSGSKDNSTSFLAATLNAVKEVVKKIKTVSPVVGIILKKIDKEKFTIDCGSGKGIEKKDYFLAIRLGKEMIHPVTKKFLGYNKEIIGLLKVIETQKFFSNLELVLENDEIDDNEIKENDIVIFKQFFKANY